MNDRETFTYDRTFTTPGGHTYFRASSGDKSGQWALTDESATHPWDSDDGVLWVVPEQVIQVGKDFSSLMVEGPEGYSDTPISTGEAMLVSAHLGIAAVISGQLLKVALVALESTPLQLTHSNGSPVHAGEWVTTATGGSGKFVSAHVQDGIAMVVVDRGRRQVVVPATAYQLTVG